MGITRSCLLTNQLKFIIHVSGSLTQNHSDAGILGFCKPSPAAFICALTQETVTSKVRYQLQKLLFDKGLIYRKYEELLQLNNKNKLIQKWAKDLNRPFSKEEYTQITNTQKRYINNMKRCSTSLVIKEMQIKTTMRYHFTSIQDGYCQNQNKTK